MNQLSLVQGQPMCETLLSVQQMQACTCTGGMQPYNSKFSNLPIACPEFLRIEPCVMRGYPQIQNTSRTSVNRSTMTTLSTYNAWIPKSRLQ